jgi:hypothetical protein
MEFVMMVRGLCGYHLSEYTNDSWTVFALYEKRHILGSFLAIWFLLSRAMNIWNGVEAFNVLETDEFCILKGTPDSSKWFRLVRS